MSKLKKADPVKVRDECISKLVNIMAEYRQEGMNSGKYNELAVHPNLAPALAYIHSVLNSKLFLNSVKYSPDFRIVDSLKICSSGFHQFALKYYPHLYSLNTDIYEIE